MTLFIERTAASVLRPLATVAHVKRQAFQHGDGSFIHGA
jgi:hypothetical protein